MWSLSHILEIFPIEVFVAASIFVMSWSYRKEKEIHEPRYLKCQQNGTNLSLTTIILVSGRLSEFVSSLFILTHRILAMYLLLTISFSPFFFY